MSTGRSFLLAAALSLAAASAHAQAPAVLDCTGPFARNANEAAVIAAFGQANVKRGDVYIGEGQSEPGTLVFPDDPKKRIEILWNDEDRRRGPGTVRIGAESEWRVAGPGGQALTVGMPMADVEKLNGKPFTLSGFDWDYGGYATDWKGGRLAKLPSGCTIAIQFERDPKASDRAADKVAGDIAFSSASTAMRAVKPFVGRILLGWPAVE